MEIFRPQKIDSHSEIPPIFNSQQSLQKCQSALDLVYNYLKISAMMYREYALYKFLHSISVDEALF